MMTVSTSSSLIADLQAVLLMALAISLMLAGTLKYSIARRAAENSPISGHYSQRRGNEIGALTRLGCSHAGSHAQSGEDGGEDGDDGLNDEFPSFFVHGEVIMDAEISYFEFSR